MRRGSVADVFARIVAQNMSAQWDGASIVVESKSGANGSIAAEDGRPAQRPMAIHGCW